jgi:hypothetical protein
VSEVVDSPKNHGDEGERAIHEDDLLTYAAGNDERLDDEIFWLIERERKREGSPIWKWFQDFDAKCRDPFNVDWRRMSGER